MKAAAPGRSSAYGQRVADRLRSAAGAGRLDAPTAVGEAGATACRGLVRLELKVDGGVITDARFQAYGCPATLASASQVVESVSGASLLDAAAVTVDDISSSLSLASEKISSADLAIEALHAALTGVVLRVDQLCPPRSEAGDLGVLVGMSGGVDSAVAALLLKQQGYRVVGATLRLWTDPECDTDGSCCSPESVRRARRVAHSLGIPHLTIDAAEAFRQEVVQYFLGEYEAGRTPNPCAKCNARLRFAVLADVARRSGLDWVATGHYARKVAGQPGLARGKDRAKDQSYVLAEASPQLLGKCLFPLGDMCKQDVRSVAARAGIEGSEQPESQEICFIPDDDYRRFLRSHLGERPGAIVDCNGTVLGHHRGTYNFTIGQRKGLGIAAGQPLFVAGLDADRAEVVVGRSDELAVDEVVVGRLTWHRPPMAGHGLAQFRSSGEAIPGRLVLSPPDLVTIVLERPAKAVAPGQTAVFYEEDVVVLAGTIVATGSVDGSRQ